MIRRPTYYANSTAQTLASGIVKPLSWLNPATYYFALNGTWPPVDPPYDALAIPEHNVRAIARVCRDGGDLYMRGNPVARVAAGAPVMLDWEGWYHRPGAVARFVQYARWVREEFPYATLSCFGLGWISDVRFEEWAALPKLVDRQLKSEARALMPLAGLMDEVCCVAYLTEPGREARDLVAFQKQVVWLRGVFQLPVQCLLSPRYIYPGNTIPVPPSLAAEAWGMAQRYAERVVVWGEWDDVVAAFGKVL